MMNQTNLYRANRKGTKLYLGEKGNAFAHLTSRRDGLQGTWSFWKNHLDSRMAQLYHLEPVSSS